jgi:uncharacterized protein YheU (UPF0270 family)
MIIPYTELSEDALEALIEDFVTRDGTDYGWDEMSRQEKTTHLSNKKGFKCPVKGSVTSANDNHLSPTP